MAENEVNLEAFRNKRALRKVAEALKEDYLELRARNKKEFEDAYQALVAGGCQDEIVACERIIAIYQTFLGKMLDAETVKQKSLEALEVIGAAVTRQQNEGEQIGKSID